MQRTPPTITSLVLGLLALAPMAGAQEQEAGAGQNPSARPAPERPGKFRSGGYFGLWLDEQGEGRARRVVLRDVLAGSEAAKLGFQKGDVILQVDGRPVRNGDQFLQLLYMTDDELARRMGRAPKRDAGSAFESAAWHWITVVRDGQSIKLDASLPKLDRQPKVGQLAPDFTAKSLDGKRDVRFSDLLGEKPLVLIFGSFT